MACAGPTTATAEERRNSPSPDPSDSNDNVKTYALCCRILVAPHPILLVVPKGTTSRVHAPSASDCGIIAAIGAGGCVLDDGAVDHVFIRGLC